MYTLPEVAPPWQASQPHPAVNSPHIHYSPICHVNGSGRQASSQQLSSEDLTGHDSKQYLVEGPHGIYQSPPGSDFDRVNQGGLGSQQHLCRRSSACRPRGHPHTDPHSCCCCSTEPYPRGPQSAAPNLHATCRASQAPPSSARSHQHPSSTHKGPLWAHTGHRGSKHAAVRQPRSRRRVCTQMRRRPTARCAACAAGGTRPAACMRVWPAPDLRRVARDPTQGGLRGST